MTDRRRPRTILAMGPQVHDMLITDDVAARLGAVVDIDVSVVVTDFNDPAHQPFLADAEVLLTGWECPPVTQEVLEKMPHLRAIVHTAGTVKGHVSPACWERGIVVSSAAQANAMPVAEYTLAAILWSGKDVLLSAQEFAKSRARVSLTRLIPGTGNYRRSVGIVGASRIGRRVIELLQPFDLELTLFDPTVSDDEAAELGVRLTTLDDLIVTSDIVTIHAPQLPATYHLFDQRRLALLRNGATLINTSRGSLVDTVALTEELTSGRISAILDVTDPEPLPPDSPLWKLPNVVLTPHVAGSHGTELGRMVNSAIDELERFARDEQFQHPVLASELGRVA